MRIRPRNKSHLVKPRNLQQQTRSLSLSLFLRFQGFQGSQKHISLSSFFCPVWWPRKKKEIRGKKRAGHAQTDVRASLSQSVDVLLVGEKDLQVVFRPTWNCVAESAAVDKISERERERRPFFFCGGNFFLPPRLTKFFPSLNRTWAFKCPLRCEEYCLL